MSRQTVSLREICRRYDFACVRNRRPQRYSAGKRNREGRPASSAKRKLVGPFLLRSDRRSKGSHRRENNVSESRNQQDVRGEFVYFAEFGLQAKKIVRQVPESQNKNQNKKKQKRAEKAMAQSFFDQPVDENSGHPSEKRLGDREGNVDKTRHFYLLISRFFSIIIQISFFIKEEGAWRTGQRFCAISFMNPI